MQAETNSDTIWQRACMIASNAIRQAIAAEQRAGGGDPLTPLVCEALLELSQELEQYPSEPEHSGKG